VLGFVFQEVGGQLLMPGARIAHGVRGSLDGSVVASLRAQPGCGDEWELRVPPRLPQGSARLTPVEARGDDQGEPSSPEVSVPGVEHRDPAWRSG